MKQMFEGHFLTLRISGKHDHRHQHDARRRRRLSAEIKIPFSELLDGTAKLPDELYAVVDTN